MVSALDKIKVYKKLISAFDSEEEEENSHDKIFRSFKDSLFSASCEEIRQTKDQQANNMEDEENWRRRKLTMNNNNNSLTAAGRDQKRKAFRRSMSCHDRPRASDMEHKQKNDLYRLNSIGEEQFVRLEMKIKEEMLWNSNVKRELEKMRKKVDIYVHLRGATEWF